MTRISNWIGGFLLLLSAGFLVGAAVILGSYNQAVTEIVELETGRLVFPDSPWPDVRLSVAMAILSFALGAALRGATRTVTRSAKGQRRVATALDQTLARSHEVGGCGICSRPNRRSLEERMGTPPCQ